MLPNIQELNRPRIKKGLVLYDIKQSGFIIGDTERNQFKEVVQKVTENISECRFFDSQSYIDTYLQYYHLDKHNYKIYKLEFCTYAKLEEY
jgi:hypothetical protein